MIPLVVLNYPAGRVVSGGSYPELMHLAVLSSFRQLMPAKVYRSATRVRRPSGTARIPEDKPNDRGVTRSSQCDAIMRSRNPYAQMGPGTDGSDGT